MNKPKIIILRGNSGSGKTTTAKALQERIGRGTLLISQDEVRREMLWVRSGKDNKSIDLIRHLVRFGYEHCEVTILEGILYADEHVELFEEVKRLFGKHIYAYFYNLSFEETLKRHGEKQKVKLHTFGEPDMRKWWRDKDLLPNIEENLVKQDMNLCSVVDWICKEIRV